MAQNFQMLNCGIDLAEIRNEGLSTILHASLIPMEMGYNLKTLYNFFKFFANSLLFWKNTSKLIIKWL